MSFRAEMDEEPRSFQELLAQARAGDRAAWEQVFDRLADCEDEGAALLAIGRKLLPQDDNARRVLDSRDLVQSALRSGWVDASQFQGETPAEFYGWMRTILRRKLAQNMRRKRPVVGLPQERDEEGAGESPDESQEPPLVDLINAETRTRLRDAIHELSEEQQEVLRLRLKGLKSPEIAEVLGIAPETVRMRESRAASKLKEILRRGPSGESLD